MDGAPGVMTMVRVRLLLVVLLVLAGALVAALAQEDDMPTIDGLPVINPEAQVHGRSMGEWSARHW